MEQNNTQYKQHKRKRREERRAQKKPKTKKKKKKKQKKDEKKKEQTKNDNEHSKEGDMHFDWPWLVKKRHTCILIGPASTKTHGSFSCHSKNKK